MKEKRYFYDWFREPVDKFFNYFAIVSLVALVIIGVIAGLVSYTVMKHKYQEELNYYPEQITEHFEKVISDVIKEGDRIDINAIPKDSYKYKINYEDEEISFVYYWREKNYDYIPSMSVKLTLSKDLKILSREDYIFTKEEYQNKTKTNIAVTSLGIAAGILILTALCIILLLVIACTVSNIHKKADEKKEKLKAKIVKSATEKD